MKMFLKTKDNWSIELKQGKEKIIYFILLIVSCIFFSYIYYEIQCGVLQSNEELSSLMMTYARKNGGASIRAVEDLIYLFFYQIFGLSYTTQRLVWSFYFFIISFFTFDICLRNNNNVINVGCIPIYIILMVLLHLSGNHISKYYGDGTFGQGFLLHYEFSLHMIVTVTVVSALWCLYRFLWSFEKKENKTITVIYECGIIVFFQFIVGFSIVDYFGYIIIPYIISKLRPVINKKNVRIFLPFLILIFWGGLFLFVHYYPQNHLRLDSIKSPFVLREQLSYFIICLLETYNIDFASDVVLADYIVFIFRGMLLISIAYIIGVCIKKFFDSEKKIDNLDTHISWAFVCVLGAFLFTNYGFYDRARYLNSLLPLGTILICKNLNVLLSKIKIKSYRGIYAISICIILLSLHKDWNFHAEDTNLIRTINLIESNQLHVGIGDIPTAIKTSVTTKGKNFVIPLIYDEEKKHFIPSIQGPETETGFVDYIVFNNSMAYMNDQFSEEYMMEYYGNPDKIIRCQNYSIMIYRKGIDIWNPQKNICDTVELEEHFYYLPKNLSYNKKVEAFDDCAILKKNGIQFGPYADLDKGNYIVKYEGESLTHADLDCYSEMDKYKIDIIYRKDNKIIYSVCIYDDVQSAEFVLANHSDTDIKITNLEIIKTDKWGQNNDK